VYDTTKLISTLKYLSSDEMQGRETGTAGSTKALHYIISQLQKSGNVKAFVKDYKQSFPMPNEVSGTNILGLIPGKKKQTIVISAHYDHEGVHNNLVYNGADDNASGVAALLAFAEYFKTNKPNHQIILAFFDAEEKGLKGSAYFVNTINQQENIVLNINLDMVSRSDKKILYASGGYHYPHVKSILEKVKTPTGISLGFGYDDPILKRNDWTSQSDHYNFHLKKIPFVYFGVEDHADYHRPTDDFERINKVFYCNSVETILRSIVAIDKGLDND
jgi:Zn-dependent M28 family amino/carboxypeptidase